MAAFVDSRYDPKQQVKLIQPALDAQRRRIGINPVNGQVYSAAQIGAIAPGSGDPTNGMLVAGTDPDYPRAMIEASGLSWGPRFGFAYDLSGNGKTAIRGGFGMFYNRHFTEVFSNTLVGQPPLLNEPTVSFGELNTVLSSTGLLYPNAVFGADKQGTDAHGHELQPLGAARYRLRHHRGRWATSARWAATCCGGATSTRSRWAPTSTRRTSIPP